MNENAYLKLAMQKQFKCVGQVYKDSVASGSCVLVSGNYVLSAAHIFTTQDYKPDTINTHGRSIIVNKPVNKRAINISKMSFEINGQKVIGKRLILHPTYLENLIKGDCDIALIELETSITSVNPAIINTSFSELNSNVIGVGFGASGPADSIKLIKALHKKIAGENTIDSLSGHIYAGKETILMCDFDHPTRTDCNKMGSSTPRPLEYICGSGDSGGGLFSLEDNSWKLVGICHSKNTDINQLMKTGNYGQTMSWARVSVFTKWIDYQIK